MVINGLGTVIAGQRIILLPPDNFTPSSNNCGGTFSLHWDAVAGATSYILQRRVNGGAWATIYEGTAITVEQVNLAPGNYDYQLMAVSPSKQSEFVASSSVVVLAQGNVGSPYRVGNFLIQDVRTGCDINGNQIGKYGCTDAAANNYDASATINEGCTYDPPCTVINPVVHFTTDWTGTAGLYFTVTLNADQNVPGGQAGQVIQDSVTVSFGHINTYPFPSVHTLQGTGNYSYTVTVGGVRDNQKIDVFITGFTIGGCA